MRKEHLIPPEKSKKVIYLQKRGRRMHGRLMAARIFGMLGVLCLLYCLSILLFMGYGTTFFLIWGAIAAACGVMAVVLNREDWLKKLPKWFKVSFITCCIAGAFVFLLVEGMIIGQFWATPQPEADYIVVLGAQWKANGPSYVLQKRLDAAVEYLQENPGTTAIVSGGQGSNEHITEAEGMHGYLIDAGISGERILIEKESTNTCENLVFSSRLLDKESDRVVLVTNNFHMFRAGKIAKKQGYQHVEGLAAGSYPGMLPNNLLREFLGVIKDFLVGNM